MQRTYLAIDLKSYYASAECAARHLDPLTTNLVVADASRTEKTICLAVSPSLKSYGIPGRARLFEVVQRVKEVNNGRLRDAIRNRTAVYKDGTPSLAAPSYDATALPPIPLLKYPIWWHHPGWRTMRRSHGRFTASISSTLPRRTSWCIPSMRYSSMPPHTLLIIKCLPTTSP